MEPMVDISQLKAFMLLLGFDSAVSSVNRKIWMMCRLIGNVWLLIIRYKWLPYNVDMRR